MTQLSDRSIELRAVQALSDDGISLVEAAQRLNRTVTSMRGILRRATGTSRWPTSIPEALLNQTGKASIKKLIPMVGNIKFDSLALAERVEKDQAAIHGPRIAALEEEARKYGMSKRARLIEEMSRKV